jgi:hypothetical protein
MKTVVLILTLGTAVPLTAGALQQISLASWVNMPPAVPSLFVAKPAPSLATQPVASLATLSVADVTVRRTVRRGSIATATIEAPDGRQFVVHRKDRLQDAVVKRIDADAVVFAEQKADALGAVRPSDVRKALRAGSER